MKLRKYKERGTGVTWSDWLRNGSSCFGGEKKILKEKKLAKEKFGVNRNCCAKEDSDRGRWKKERLSSQI